MARIEVFTVAGGTLFYAAVIGPFGTAQQHLDAARTYTQWSDRAHVVVTGEAGIRREIAEYEAAMAARRSAGIPDWAPAPLSGAGCDEAWEHGPGRDAQ